MIDREKLHEQEIFTIDFAAIEGNSVIEHFDRIGARFMDDFFSAPVEDAKPWQSVSAWSASCHLQGEQVYPDESRVDRIDFSYLFASTPFHYVMPFNRVLKMTISAFSANLSYRDKRIEPGDVPKIALGWLEDLRSELAEEPGNESLAILIQDLFD